MRDSWLGSVGTPPAHPAGDVFGNTLLALGWRGMTFHRIEVNQDNLMGRDQEVRRLHIPMRQKMVSHEAEVTNDGFDHTIDRFLIRLIRERVCADAVVDMLINEP